MSFEVGSRVWVPDPSDSWALADVSSFDGARVGVVVQGRELDLGVDEVAPFDPSHLMDLDDLSTLNLLHEAPLLDSLRRRYKADNIYTLTGDVLISLNPYKTIPLLYELPTEETLVQATQEGFFDDEREPVPPHVFETASKAYHAMLHSRRNQSVIISGESGAGKTEASKYVMRYLAAASSCRAASDGGSGGGAVDASGIEGSVLGANPILEAFGNAKTVRNDNSSRFGKYIMLQYNADGRMHGAKTNHFLLEKSRLVSVDRDERNYHIFYQLCAALPDEAKAPLQLGAAGDYAYLNSGGCLAVETIDDVADFAEVLQSMEVLGIGADEQAHVWRLLAAILHLGNASFVPQEGQDRLAIEAPVSIGAVAEMLGVPQALLEVALVNRTATSGRGSVISIELNEQQASDARHAVVKLLYNELFSWLVKRINSAHAHRQGGGEVAGEAFIGILDIFGFEILQHNSFEQLCINFANESLQKQFNHHVFVNEEKAYREEGIDFASVQFRDNQECLDLIAKKPWGLLCMLDEQTMLGRAVNNHALLQSYHNQHLDKHPNYAKPRFESDDFIIKHFAGDVTYDINGFMEKNNDTLTENLMAVLKRSSHPLLVSIFALGALAEGDEEAGDDAPEPATPSRRSRVVSRRGGGGKGPVVTVSNLFREQLASLMDMLWATEPHYIKCIKPNNIKFAGGFSSDLVLNQLRYSGALEVVRIRRQGFPMRMPFAEFHERYEILARFSHPFPGHDAKDACEHILGAHLDEDQFQLGHSLVFLRHGMLEEMDAAVRRFYHERALVVQNKYRTWKTHRQFVALKAALVLLQARARTQATRKAYQQQRRAAQLLQSLVKRDRRQAQFQRERAAAVRLHSVARGFLARQLHGRKALQKRAATRIQARARGRQARAWYAAERAAFDGAQTRLAAVVRARQERRRYEHAYATVIAVQAMARANKARREYLKGKEATVRSQAIIRRFQQRQKFLKEKRMAVRLQAVGRMLPRRRQFARDRACAVRVQALHRQRAARARFVEQREAVVRLQTWTRGCFALWQYRSSVEQVVKIQARIRAFVGARRLEASKRACARLQLAVRAFTRCARLRRQVRAVHAAAAAGDVAGTLRVLEENPAVRFVRNKADAHKTLMHAACSQPDPAVVHAIGLDYHELALRDGLGNTPMHYAAGTASLELVKALGQCLAAEATLVSFAQRSGRGRRASIGNSAGHAQGIHARRGSASASAAGAEDGAKSGYLKKRRERGRWQKRWVVLAQGTLSYYHKPTDSNAAMVMTLQNTMVKKSDDIPNCLELHSPDLMRNRNKEGRLYFQAANEIELQSWFTPLRQWCASTGASASTRTKPVDVRSLDNVAAALAATNAREQTPLHLCARASAGDSLSLCQTALWLIEMGGHLDAQDADGMSAVHFAVAENHLELAAALTRKGADLTLASAAGAKPLDLAQGDEAVAALTTGHVNEAERMPLLPAPAARANSTHVSLFLEALGVSNPTALHHPFLRFSVFDSHHNLVEPEQDTDAVILTRSTFLWWGLTWHMQTPVENLTRGALAVVQLMQQAPGSAQPQCRAWGYFLVDHDSIDSQPVNLEMLQPPVDLSLPNNMRKADAFLNGDEFVRRSRSD